MQCNTNYTNDQNNFNFLNLNVIKQFKKIWPGLPLGLSDHTQGHTSVIGSNCAWCKSSLKTLYG